MHTHTQSGFTLLELITTISIIAILLLISYPLYTQHVLKTRRIDAEVALLNLATAIEGYYSLNNSYVGATLATVGVNAYTHNQYYRLEISDTAPDSYVLRAIPENTQKNDTRCGTLSLNQMGEKNVSGTDSINACW